MGRIGALCLIALLLGGCASHQPSPRTPAGRPLHLRCPATAPAEHGTATLRSEPTAAIVCLANEPPQKRLPGAPVRRGDARTLVRLVDAASEASAAQRARCAPTRRLVAVVVRFGYSDGTTRDLVEQAPGCGGVVFVGNRGYALPAVLGEFLFDMTMPGQPAHGPRVVAGELVDDRTRPGTALFRSGRNVLIAIPPDAPPCTTRNLAIRYVPGGAATGSDFGTFELRNTSAGWCAVPQVRITGLDTTGRAITPTATASAIAPLALFGAELIAQIQVLAAYRDDPSAPNGLCESRRIVPRTWRLTLSGSTVTVPNGTARSGVPVGSDGLVTCRGRFSARPAQLRA